MGLLKAESTGAASVVPFSMADIEQQAHAIIVRAKNQAARILAEAQRIGEQMKTEAHEQGLQDGLKAGTERGLVEGRAAGKEGALSEHRAALSQLIETLTTVTSELDASRRLLESETSTDVLKLAVAIARRATKKLGERDPSVVTENVRDAMKLAVSASDIRIAVHPSQKSTLESVLPSLQREWPKLEHVAIVDEQSIAPGGCRIFTAGGQIDADLDEQVDRIASDLVQEPT